MLKIKNLKNFKLDITNLKLFKKIIYKIQPDYIFHLAAQSLVKTSYRDPRMTFNINSLGTLNVLEALRYLKKNVQLY